MIAVAEAAVAVQVVAAQIAAAAHAAEPITAALAAAESTALPQASPPDDPLSPRSLAGILGFGVGSLVVAGAGALVYRWYTRERIPVGLAFLLGLSAAGLYLGTVGLLGDLLRAEVDPFALATVFRNLLALGAAAAAAPIGRLLGDSLATDVFAVAGVRELDADVSRLVRSVGRVTPIELPEEIGDAEGYDPVPAAAKAEIAGKTLLFPRRLTTAELRDRLAARLKEDYGVGHVDFDFDGDGAIEFLAVGSRVAGIGPTLAPGAVAAAIRADPASDASPGDRVQIWRTTAPEGGVDAAEDGESAAEPATERVATGELRAAVDDVATVAVDEADAEKLDATTTYRLLTLPAEPQADREFASLLRAADETMGAVVVGEGSDLAGATVESLDVTVAAIRSADGAVEPIPPRSRTLAAGDTAYVVARPDGLRRLEARGEAAAEA